MDTDGRLYQLDDKQLAELERESGKPLIPLTKNQHDELEPMGVKQRKGWMRNKPCICGSGVKFKRCCWSKYA